MDNIETGNVEEDLDEASPSPFAAVFLFRAGSTQQHTHANYCGRVLLNPPCLRLAQKLGEWLIATSKEHWSSEKNSQQISIATIQTLIENESKQTLDQMPRSLKF